MSEHELIPVLEGIPEGWEIKKLEEIASIRIGGTPRRDNPIFWDEHKNTKNAWVAISDMRVKTISETREYISDLGVKASNVKLIPEGSILLSFKLSLGKLAFAGRDLYTNEAIAGLVTFPEMMSSEFLYHALSICDFEKEVDEAVKGKTLNKDKLTRLEIILPPLLEQQRISRALQCLDATLEVARELELQARRVREVGMQQLFTRGENNWQEVTLESICHKVTDMDHKMPQALDEGIPLISVADFTDSGIDYSRAKKISNEDYSRLSRKLKLEKDDLLFTRYGTIGVIRRIESDLPVIASYSIAMIKPNADKISKKFLFYALHSPEVQTQAADETVQSAQPD